MWESTTAMARSSLLIACPMRIKNLADLVIGQHLVFDGQAYGLI
jgi:hypothetical protein